MPDERLVDEELLLPLEERLFALLLETFELVRVRSVLVMLLFDELDEFVPLFDVTDELSP